MPSVTKERAKELAAEEAVKLVGPNEIIAIGSGSTVNIALQKLATRFSSGPGKPRLVAASKGSEELARELGFQVLPLVGQDTFRIMLDGADEIAPDLTLIKGGGGAHTREKLLAKMSGSLVIMADFSKLVNRLGEMARLPVEVVPFATPYVARELRKLSLDPVLRLVRERGGVPFMTDNGNQILDLRVPAKLVDPTAFDRDLKQMVGIVETGLFVGMVERVFVGLGDGKVEMLSRGPATSANQERCLTGISAPSLTTEVSGPP